MTSPNVDLCASNNIDGKCWEIASFWRVFIKFRWHGQKLTHGHLKQVNWIAGEADLTLGPFSKVGF